MGLNLGKIADYTPFVSNAKGLIQGDYAQALGGPVKEIGEDALRAGKDAYNDAKDVLTLDEKPEQQKKVMDDAGAAATFLRDRAQAGASAVPAPTVAAAPIAAQPAVTAGTMQGTRIAQPVLNMRNQQGAIGMLQDAASGASPSAAELMLRRQSGRDQANQLGMAAALQNGRSVGGALNAASRGAAQIASDTNANAAIVRAQEMAAAREALANASNAARGQDITVNTSQAGLTQDAAKTNLLATLDAAKTTAGNNIDVAKANQTTDLSGQQATGSLALQARQLGLTEGSQAYTDWLNALQIQAGLAGGIDNANIVREKGNRDTVTGAIGGGFNAGLSFLKPGGA